MHGPLSATASDKRESSTPGSVRYGPYSLQDKKNMKKCILPLTFPFSLITIQESDGSFYLSVERIFIIKVCFSTLVMHRNSAFHSQKHLLVWQMP